MTKLYGLGVVWAVKHFRPYLYKYQCDIYRDHEALKSLLNIPQPSGKLARMGYKYFIDQTSIMLIQMLSRAPAQGSEVEGEESYCDTVAVIQPASELPALQREDKELKERMIF